MSRQRLIVLKFGGSVLRDENTLRGAVHEIHRWRRDDYRVVAVVSALAGATDALLQSSLETHPEADPHSVAAVVAGGELQSAALLGLLLDRAGIPGQVLPPGSIRLIANGPALDAEPKRVNLQPILGALEADEVVVVPGFVACDEQARTVVLGRGGSDLTAFFLASHLEATRCRLVKDVDGLYESDPATAVTTPSRYGSISWEVALQLDGQIVQHKAIRYARDHGLEFELCDLNGVLPTTVGAGPTRFELRRPSNRRLRVSLLGLGTVGSGLFELLRGMPELFELTAVLVRDPDKLRAVEIPPQLLATDTSSAIDKADIVVEALGGLNPAGTLIKESLRRGACVVTANKAVVAAERDALSDGVRQGWPRVRRSATVGGCTPLLERLAANPRDVRSVRGVLNGTVNFILDGLSLGREFEELLKAARELGFAERDATRDLSGQDAADKLAVTADLLSWDLDTSRVECEALDESLAPRALCAAKVGRRLRQVSTLWVEDGVTRARVRFEELEADDPLFATSGEANAIVLDRWTKPNETVRGKGAGRWPTAESLMGDLLGIARERCSASTSERNEARSPRAEPARAS